MRGIPSPHCTFFECNGERARVRGGPLRGAIPIPLHFSDPHGSLFQSKTLSSRVPGKSFAPRAMRISGTFTSLRRVKVPDLPPAQGRGSSGNARWWELGFYTAPHMMINIRS